MTGKFLLVALLAALMPIYACQAQVSAEPFSANVPVVIDKQLTPQIGGIKQVVEIKTDDARKPILLFLSGGPGSSMIRNADVFTNLLKSRFTIVQWDQRDAGKTLALNPSPIRPSVGLMETDTLEVVQFVIKELKQEKIYLLGSSWGNVLGFSVVRNHPELLHAYFAVNPVVSQMASETALLKTLKVQFSDNAVAVKELNQVDLAFTSDSDLFYLRKWLFVKEGQKFATTDGFKVGFLEWSTTWAPVWAEVMKIDLPMTLKKIDCPVYFFVGKNDVQTLTKITEDYFYAVKAPKKALVVFDNSGHQVHHDEPEKFQQAIIKTLN